MSVSFQASVPPWQAVTSLAFRGSRVLVAGHSDQRMLAYDATNGYSLLQTMVFHRGAVTSIAFTSRGSLMLSTDVSGRIVFTLVRRRLEH